jgi:photosystem II stability/assembly factor-like uncharacterized protein
MKKLALILGFIFCITTASAQWELKLSGTTELLHEINFPSLSTGFCVGDNGTILKTIDIGETWSSLESTTSQNLFGVYFTTVLNGFVVGDNIMLQTTDGGENWSEVILPVSAILHDIEFIDEATGFVVGFFGTLLKTTDGGATWLIKDSDCSRNLVNVQFPSAMVGYAVSRGYNWNFIKTIDGGETWMNDSIVPIENLSNLEAVYFTTETEGVIGGWYIGALVKTNDGGDSWSDVAPDGEVDQFISIDFPSTSIGYAMCYGGKVFVTTDGGDTWALDAEITGFEPTSVKFITNSTGFGIGSDGKIYKITDESVSIESKGLEQGILVYPNPIVEDFTLQVPDSFIGAAFVLYNLLGEEMQTVQITSTSTRIKCAALQSGHYVGIVRTDEIQIVKPFVKQ